jgi:hypothetical protein
MKTIRVRLLSIRPKSNSFGCFALLVSLYSLWG